MHPFSNMQGGGGGDLFFGSVTFLSHFEALTDVKGHSLTAFGNAAISSTQKKFGTSSLSCDGAGDYVTSPSSSDWTFGAADFTIDGWVYFNAVAASQCIVSNIQSNVNNDAFRLWLDITTGKLSLRTWNTNLVLGATAISAATWYHIAVTFDGTTYRLFLNGVLEATGATVQNLNAVNQLWLGQTGVAGTEMYLNGYIDDLRITKGACRYTAAFTPPIAALPDY